MNRTPDLLITNELLYRLSYTGVAFDYSVVAFGSFPMIAGAEFAAREFLHIKKDWRVGTNPEFEQSPKCQLTPFDNLYSSVWTKA